MPAPVIWGLGGLLRRRVRIDDYMSETSRSRLLMMNVGIGIWELSFIIFVGSYALLRLFVIVESFSSLLYLPPAAFQDI